MSVIKTNFYNIFWQNKTCRNVFLLSKEELLETVTFGEDKNSYSYSVNKIIISNVQDNLDEFETIKFRNEHYNNELDVSLEDKIEYFKPILDEFYSKNLEKPIEKLIEDIDKKGWKLLVKVTKIFSNQNTIDKKLLGLLQEYGFVGKHLTSMKQVEDYIESKLLPKKGNELINEQTITTFFEGIKFIKELYVNHSYKRLYNTNQILVNTLNSEDNFQSRMKLFRFLYEGKIILPSKEDAFIECTNCEPDAYKGVFQLKLSPHKLKDLKCPICSSQLTYFIPYQLDKEIYDIIKEKDGLILSALTNKLKEYNFTYLTNKTFLNDIEIDCMYEAVLGKQKVTFIVETKMLKLNTSKNKLKNKIRKHYGKLLEDINRLKDLKEFKGKTIKPLLLVNVTDTNLISQLDIELKQSNPNILNQYTDVMNLELLKFEHKK
ncbi:hypothetical protein [Psychroserpens sp.]